MIDSLRVAGGSAMQTVSVEQRGGVRSHAPRKSFWSFFGYLNVLAALRRRKAERLLLQSFKSSYPRWEKEGFIRKPR